MLNSRGRIRFTLIRLRSQELSGSRRLQRHPDLNPAMNLLMQRESRRQLRLKLDPFSGDGVVEIQKLGVQEISSVAGEAGEIFKRLAG
jgi:hypothetical protein